MSKRFLHHNATRMLPIVKAHDPNAKLGPASSSWAGGCSDPNCCMQLPNADAYSEIVCNLSGNKLHEIFLKVSQYVEIGSYESLNLHLSYMGPGAMSYALEYIEGGYYGLRKR